MVLIQRMVRRIPLSLPLVAILSFFSVFSRAEQVPTATELLEKVVESSTTVSYEGKMTVMTPIPMGNAFSEAIVIRKAPDKLRTEFVSPPEIAGTGLVINGKDRWPIVSDGKRPGRPFIREPLQRSVASIPPENVQLLLRNYDIRVLEGGTVADRDTYFVEVDPRAKGRPSRRIWVDKKNGLILKLEEYDAQNKIRGLFVFSKINFNPKIDMALFKKHGNLPPRREELKELWNYRGGEPDITKIKKEAQLDLIVPSQAPNGFILQSIQMLDLGKRRSIYLKYTDGLTIISVFESPKRRGLRLPWLHRSRGRIRGDELRWQHGRVEELSLGKERCDMMSTGPMLVLAWNCGDVSLTLIGDLAKEEMIKFARSFVKEEKGERLR